MIKQSVIIFLWLGLTTASLQAQELTELDKRNGFKTIKLGSPIDSVKGAKFKKDIKEKDEPAKLYAVEHEEYSSIGGVQVKHIEVKTYNNLIYEIFVVTEKDSRLMRAMENIFGKADYSAKNESYNWRGKNVSLRFKSHSKDELELQYRSNQVIHAIKKDKNKQIETIADDI